MFGAGTSGSSKTPEATTPHLASCPTGVRDMSSATHSSTDVNSVLASLRRLFAFLSVYERYGDLSSTDKMWGHDRAKPVHPVSPHVLSGCTYERTAMRLQSALVIDR